MSLPATDHMLEGLRMARRLGSQSLAVITGRDPMLRSMCGLDFPALGWPPPVAEEEPADSFELLLAMQRIVASEPDVIMTCSNELETTMAIVAASRVNSAAKAMLMFSADTNAVYSGVGGALAHLMAPTGWHFTQSSSCRVFGTSANFVQAYRDKFGSDPSSLDAAALGAALAVMSAVEQTTFEGEDTEKNLLLTQTLRSGQGTNTSYGYVQFGFNGTSPRQALTLQLVAEELSWTSKIVTETNLSSLVYPLPDWVSKSQGGASTCDGEGPGYIINPNILLNSSSGAECLPCPAGETGSANSQYCKVCPAGTFNLRAGSPCFQCDRGADCQRQGTALPPSMPGYYRLDAHPGGVPYFALCLWPSLCLGNNECSGSNAGVLCSSCTPGHTNVGFFRNRGVCGDCFPIPVLVLFLLIYIGIVYFIIAKTAQASEQGQLWKRVVAYCQLCCAASKGGYLTAMNPFLELVTDMILFPFHSVLGPDCWFAGGVAKEVYVVIVGVAMLPCLVLGTAVFFIVWRGIEQTRGRKRRHGSTAAGDRAKIVKDYFSTVAKDTTRWSVATLYLLYCPTLAVNVGSVSFMSLDALRLRFFPDVLASDVVSVSIISVSIAVLFGLGVPTFLWLIIRRLKRRHLLKDSQWQYVFGMLYNDMKPDFWYFEILLFFQKFVFMLATAIPFELMRIFVLMAIGFIHTVSLLLTHPFSSAGGYILIKLEFSFLFSLIIILACQVLLVWASAQPSAAYWGYLQVAVPVCVLTAHAVFAFLALRAFLISAVYHPLVLKAISMPEAMSRSERFLFSTVSLPRISWDREHQRINFLGFSHWQRKRLTECILSALDAYVFTRHAKPVFHASFLCVAVDQAIESCKEARTKQLKETHSQMLQRGGCTGLLRKCPGLASAAPAAAEGIELAKQKRAEKRSLVAALPRVCTPQASIDELLTVFDRQHVKIMKGKEIFFKPWETPIELKLGPELESKESRRRSAKRSELLRVLNAPGRSDVASPRARRPKPEDPVDTRLFSPGQGQLQQRIPDLRKEVTQLRQVAEGLRLELQQVQAQIEVHKARGMVSDQEMSSV